MRQTFSSKLSRRHILQGTGGLAAATLLGGALPARAASELRILMGGGSWKEMVEEAFFEPFATSRSIEIVWRLGLTQEPLVMAQQRRPQWDLSHSNQTGASQLGAMGFYRPWSVENIPNLDNVHPSFRYEYLAGKCHTPYGLSVNTQEITRNVESWLDLWDPAFKGRVAFPAWNWVGEEVFHALNIVFGGTVDNIEPSVERFQALFRDNECKILNNPDHVRQMLVSGEVWLCPNYQARTEQAAAAGAPVEFRLPKEGGMSWIWNTAIVANRPDASTELAEACVNVTLDPERQIAFSRLIGYPPTNMEAMRNLPPDLKRLEYTDEELELFGRLQSQIDYMAMFAYRDEYAEIWNRDILQAS